LLKRERTRHRTLKTRKDARRDIFGYIEMFYNPKRKHAKSKMLSPVEFENRRQNVNQEGVWETKAYSVSQSGDKVCDRTNFLTSDGSVFVTKAMQ